MTLTTRLSLFFSLLLAIVLMGFSAALFLLAAVHFQRQSDERHLFLDPANGDLRRSLGLELLR